MPSLRQVGLRPRFMHDGSLNSGNDIIEFYHHGGGPNANNRDPLMQPFGINQRDRGRLLDFLFNALTDPRVAQGVAPFDRPTLRSDLLGSGGMQYGVGSVGSGALTPEILPEVPGNIGNSDFKVGVHHAVGGAPALFILSPTSSSLQVGGVNINVGLAGNVTMPMSLHGPAGSAGQGYGTVRAPIPNYPSLQGRSLYAQWLILDQGVPAGVAGTRGAEIRLF